MDAMGVDSASSSRTGVFKEWLLTNGAYLHPQVTFEEVLSGFSVVATQDLPPDTTVVSCPFSLAVTHDTARQALSEILPTEGTALVFTGWSERQLICTYICLHWIVGRSRPSALRHWPYLDMLPSPEKLRTPLHFTSTELEAFRGTNLYGATLDRHKAWLSEWEQIRNAIANVRTDLAAEFTWERYLTASTYLSSRAFPSTLLSPSPSVNSAPSSYPVLLPGVDSLNHARAQPVSWIVSENPTSSSDSSEPAELAISLVLHNALASGSELFNNYGPKPNSELILGYGFTLPNNPDDTIVLKIGGTSQQGGRWEVGRNAHGAEPVWDAVLAAICEDLKVITVADQLDAAGMLAQMAESLYNRLPPPRSAENGDGMRPEVALMLEHYLEGQRSILQALIKFARDREQQAIETAQAEGLQIVEEEDDE